MDYSHILKWVTIAGTWFLGIVAARRAWGMRVVPSELRSAALIATPTFSPVLTRAIRRMMALAPAAKVPPGVRTSEHLVDESHPGPPVRVVVFEREAPSPSRPALLWIHGGGYVIGTPEQDMTLVSQILDRLDVVIVSVDYRLAPEHPFPAALDDCDAILRWMVEQAHALGIDAGRIAVAGRSAGGGLAAALAQRVADSGPIAIALQLLIYPMLDARTTARDDHGDRGRFVWTPQSNRFGWASYLGRDPAAGGYPDYAVPAQRADLKGLAPAWIGVGTLDLFYDEDVEYGERLRTAGVACDIHVTAGGYHGFDIMRPRAIAAQRFLDAMVTALKRSLDPA